MGYLRTPRQDWPADDEIARLLVEARGVVADVAKAIGVPDTSLRSKVNNSEQLRAARDAGRDDGKLPETERTRSVTSDDPAEWADVRALLQRRGLSLEDVIPVRVRVNEWGDPDAPSTQLRVDCVPRLGLLMPARADGWKPPKVPKRKRSGSELVAFFGDHHAPHHDPQLHAAVCEWLREFKPDRAVILGDLLDLDRVSRHRPTPEMTASVQDTVDAGYAILRGYVEASPGTRFQALGGNHEDRLRNAIIDQLSALHGLTRADGQDELPVLSVPFLLRMDELGIEWCDPNGEYQHGQIQITSELAARHGWIASKGSGSSALRTIDHLRYSCVVGHTHRQSIVFHSAHGIDGKPRTLLGCEAGTLARLDSTGLGYAPNPDWQAGFATARCYDDGTFKLDLATYVDGALMWGDWRCRP